MQFRCASGKRRKNCMQQWKSEGNYTVGIGKTLIFEIWKVRNVEPFFRGGVGLMIYQIKLSKIGEFLKQSEIIWALNPPPCQKNHFLFKTKSLFSLIVDIHGKRFVVGSDTIRVYDDRVYLMTSWAANQQIIYSSVLSSYALQILLAFRHYSAIIPIFHTPFQIGDALVKNDVRTVDNVWNASLNLDCRAHQVVSLVT